MWKDVIVAEVRKVREKYAAKFGYNLDVICRMSEILTIQTILHLNPD